MIPDELRCKATMMDKPVAGVPLFATFEVLAKNAYSFIFGPTSSDGIAILPKAQIISEAQDQLNLALMDYNPLEGAFSGGITVRAVSHEDARQALIAFKQFRKHVRYPEGYEEMLDAALKNPMLHDTHLITVTKL